MCLCANNNFFSVSFTVAENMEGGKLNNNNDEHETRRALIKL